MKYSEDNELTEVVEEIKEKKEDLKEKKRTAEMLSLVGQLGYSISLPIIGGAFLGRLLDVKFDSSPRITLSLIFFGLFIGITNIYFVFKKLK